METADLFARKDRQALERDVIASESQYGASTQQQYSARVGTARTFMFVFEGEDYVKIYKAFQAVKKPGESNSDAFKRLVEKEYSA